MIRLLAGIAILAGVVGAGIGWIFSSSLYESASPVPSPTPITPRHFPLTPADIKVIVERPAVAVDARGRVLLAWASATAESERTLFLAPSDDGGTTFDSPTAFRKVPILRFKSMTKGKNVVRSSNVLPRLVALGDTIVLGWTEPSGKDKVDYLVASSTDGGRTFSEPDKVHGPACVRPTFTSLAAGPDGSLACAWLDHRGGCQQPFFAERRADNKSFATEQMVFGGPDAKGVCPCCDTDVLCAPDRTTFVAFRNSDNDIREMHVSRRLPKAADFEPPVPVSTNNWKFPGCPHDGPAMALTPGRLHVAWMDGHSGKQRVYCSHSPLTALTFKSRPLGQTFPGQQGHPRLAADGNFVHAVWDGSLAEEPAASTAAGGHRHAVPAGSGRAIMYARWAADDDGAISVRPLAPQTGKFQINPALAIGPGGDVFVAWHEIAESGKSVAFLHMPATSTN